MSKNVALSEKLEKELMSITKRKALSMLLKNLFEES